MDAFFATGESTMLRVRLREIRSWSLGDSSSLQRNAVAKAIGGTMAYSCRVLWLLGMTSALLLAGCHSPTTERRGTSTSSASSEAELGTDGKISALTAP